MELKAAKEDIQGTSPKEYIQQTYKFPKRFEDFTEEDHKMVTILTQRHNQLIQDGVFENFGDIEKGAAQLDKSNLIALFKQNMIYRDLREQLE